jgi:hypothetical protein
MTGYNRPTRIGAAICMPGDVVFGSAGGVCFIPAHLVEETVDSAEKSHVIDIFGFQRLKERKYTPAQIDQTWSGDMWTDFLDWFKKSDEVKDYRHLNWDKDPRGGTI